MAFNFPNTPSDGTVFTPSGGPTYTYSGGVWKLSGGGSGFVVVSDTAPPTPFPGMLWWESDSGALWFWYVDANSSQWVQVNFTPTGVATAETRNRLVNGAMQISQENGNTSVGMATNPFPVDQWITTNGSGTFAASAQRVQVVTPNGSQNRLRVTITAGGALGSAGSQISQYIEGIRVADFQWGTAQAKQVMLRFGWKSPAGTWTVSIRNAVTDRTYMATFTIAAGQANTDTVQTFVIPGDVTGTWAVGSTAGMIVTFAITAITLGVPGWQAGNFAGATGQSNGGATTNNIFELFDVGLYLDPLATGVAPAWTMPDEAQELAACQRYWAKMPLANVSMNFNAYAAGAYTKYFFPIPLNMRVLPALATVVPGMTVGGGAQVGAASVSSINMGWLWNTTTISGNANVSFAAGDYYAVNSRM